jgi:CUE domain
VNELYSCALFLALFLRAIIGLQIQTAACKPNQQNLFFQIFSALPISRKTHRSVMIIKESDIHVTSS